MGSLENALLVGCGGIHEKNNIAIGGLLKKRGLSLQILSGEGGFGKKEGNVLYVRFKSLVLTGLCFTTCIL